MGERSEWPHRAVSDGPGTGPFVLQGERSSVAGETRTAREGQCDVYQALAAPVIETRCA